MSEQKPLRISAERARELLEGGQATPLDVIDSHSYEDYDLQIKGAVRIAPEDIGEDYQQLPEDHAALAY